MFKSINEENIQFQQTQLGLPQSASCATHVHVSQVPAIALNGAGLVPPNDCLSLPYYQGTT